MERYLADGGGVVFDNNLKHMPTSYVHSFQQFDQTDRQTERPTETDLQRSATAIRRLEGRSIRFAPAAAGARPREREGKRRNSRRPRQARLLRSRSPTYYFSVGRRRRRRPLGNGRISVRNLDLTLWKAFIAAPLHKGQREIRRTRAPRRV